MQKIIIEYYENVEYVILLRDLNASPKLKSSKEICN